MRYEFSWHDGKSVSNFRTDCPVIGEAMMRSSSDFPKRTEDIQTQFQAIYGTERGKFEQLLRNANPKGISEVQTGIKGLTVRTKDSAGIEGC